MKKRKLFLTLCLIFSFAGHLFAEDTSLTTITILNARQTTYENNEKTGEDSIILEDSVEITVSKGSTVTEIKADKVTYDRKTEMLYAQGNVEIITKTGSQGAEKTTASSLLMNTSTLEGFFEDGRVIQTQSDALNLPSGSTLIVFSDVFGKSENNTISFKNSSLTFCDDEDPHWHIDATRTWLLPGGEFAFLNALLYVGPVPVLYFPAFYYPKDELIFNPVFGSKPREGKYIQTTTYLIGRKPLASSSTSSSSTDSSSEESLKAVYNFMRPTELKMQERQGLMLHNLDQSFTGDTSTYLKFTADWYSNLGTMIGLDGNFKPSNKYISSLKFNVNLGFSNTIFSINNYNTISPQGYEYKDNSNFLGLELPFRYGADFELSLSKPFRLSLSLPIYSDPYFSNDFSSRDESMNWISYLTDLGKSAGSNNSVSTTSSDSSKNISSLTWKLSASYSPNLPVVIKPYISSLSLSLNSSVNISSVENKNISNDDRAKNNDDWVKYTPERSFFYPSQVTPVNLSINTSGTIFQWPLADKKVSSEKVDYKFSLNKPDSLKSQTEIQKELELEQKQKDLENKENEDQEKNEEDVTKENLEEKPEDKFLTLLFPQLQTSKSSVSQTYGLKYNLGYTINSNVTTQISYSTTDAQDNLYLKQPSDFEWDKIKSYMYTIKTPISLSSNLSYGNTFFSMSNKFSFDPVWQGHPNTDGYSDEAKKTLQNADLSAQNQTILNTNSVSLKPFVAVPMFAESGIVWKNSIKMYQKIFSGDVDNPQWDEKGIEWDNPDSITVNSLDFIFALKEADSRYKQSLTFTSTLKPQLPKYSGNLILVFPYVNFSLSTSVQETSKTDSTLIYNPLQQSLSLSLLNSNLKISESLSYVYNDNTENNDNYFQNLNLSLRYKQLSFSLTHLYTYKYDLYTNEATKPADKVLGYNIRDQKEFVPYSASFSYSVPSKTDYKWFNRISITPGLSTNLSYDFIRPTSSYFQLSASLTFNITDFLKLSFSANSRNSTIYWYFQNEGLYSNKDVYGNNFMSRMLVDTVQSFGLYGVAGGFWNEGAFEQNRLASGFKLKSLNMNLTHELHDWKFNMNWKFEPKIVTKSGVKTYDFTPTVSIGIVWNPMESIKSDITYKYDEKEESGIWTLQ